jgi:membrane-bound metal-dependent hydrolase YbcI (DUF457 family)
MPYPIAHACLGAGIVAAILPGSTKKKSIVAPLMIGAALAIAADCDLFFVWFMHMEGVHRSFSHSLPFAVVIGILIAVALGRAQLRLAIAYSLAFMSHGLLDYATTAHKYGTGVELFWPFSTERMKLGWFDIHSLLQGSGAYSPLISNLVEFAIFVPPLAAVLLLKWLRKQQKMSATLATPVIRAS